MQSVLARPGIVGAVALALFVNIGSIKSHPLLAWMPVDPTIILAALLVASIFNNAIRARSLPRAIVAPIAVLVALIPGIANAITPYGIDKWRSFSTITALALVAAVIVLREARQRAAFLRTIAWLGIIVTVLVTVAPETTSDWSDVVTLPGSNTISTSQIILAGAIVVSMDIITVKRRVPAQILRVMLGALMIFTALNTGSRGPVISAAVGVVLALLLAPTFRRRRGRSVFAIVFLAGAALVIANQVQGDGLSRVLSFLGGEQDTSTMARSAFWRIAWSYIQNTPAGGGWGYFGTLPEVAPLVMEGDKLYPHNVLIEIFLEGGWLVGLSFVALIIASGLRLISRAHTGPVLTMFVLVVFAVINALLSGDINDNRLMWVMLALTWIIPRPAPQDEITPASEIPAANRA